MALYSHYSTAYRITLDPVHLFFFLPNEVQVEETGSLARVEKCCKRLQQMNGQSRKKYIHIYILYCVLSYNLCTQFNVTSRY